MEKNEMYIIAKRLHNTLIQQGIISFEFHMILQALSFVIFISGSFISVADFITMLFSNFNLIKRTYDENCGLFLTE